MRDSEVDSLYNNIVFDLDTIRIEQTSIDNPKKLFETLRLLNEIKDNINDRFSKTRGK